MRSLIAASLAAMASLAAPAMGGDRPVVVVELFTSQGCSSCPPADALIEELAARDDVLPLALHVDYWDYIGWADSFARPQNTARQKAYARMAGEGSIYTPQIVVGGVDHIVGYKPMKVAELMQAHGALPELVEIDAAAADGVLTVKCIRRIEAGAAPLGANVDLVAYVPSATVEIEHGENAGQVISYANIVTSWERLGTWDGVGDFELTTPVPPAGRLAVIVQEPGPGRVLAAFRVR